MSSPSETISVNDAIPSLPQINTLPNINTNNSSPPTSSTQSLKDGRELNKDNYVLNTFFFTLTIISFIGTFYMIMNYEDYWKQRESFKPEGYVTPKLSDLNILFLTCPLMCLIKFLFNTFTTEPMSCWVSKKYKNPLDNDNYQLGLVYKKKMATSLFKLCYYIVTVIFGFIVLTDLEFMPWQIFGKGELSMLYSKGEPGYIFWNKPAYFNEYYLISVSFVSTDLIWLLFIYERQTDFFLMLLHHSLTISLIIFSYLSGLDNHGAIILFFHDITDVIVYWLRIVINSDSKEIFKLVPSALLLCAFIFYRLYFFGSLILTQIKGYPQWNAFNSMLTLFQSLLIIAHFYWTSQIILRFVVYKFTDIGDVKKTKNK